MVSVAASVPQSAAAGLHHPRCPYHASEAFPHATHVHHGVAALLQTGGPLRCPLGRRQSSDLSAVVATAIRLTASSPQLFGWIAEKFRHQAAAATVLALMAVQGIANLHAQWGIIGEFSNPPQEELLGWIQEKTAAGGLTQRRQRSRQGVSTSACTHTLCVCVSACAQDRCLPVQCPPWPASSSPPDVPSSTIPTMRTLG